MTEPSRALWVRFLGRVQLNEIDVGLAPALPSAPRYCPQGPQARELVRGHCIHRFVGPCCRLSGCAPQCAHTEPMPGHRHYRCFLGACCYEWIGVCVGSQRVHSHRRSARCKGCIDRQTKCAFRRLLMTPMRGGVIRPAELKLIDFNLSKRCGPADRGRAWPLPCVQGGSTP